MDKKNPCEKYESKEPGELDKLLLQGEILGWAPKPQPQRGSYVLCQERFDDRSATGDTEPPGAQRVAFGFQLLSGEARPGTGIVAVRKGREVGPTGALGLFLTRRDTDEVWLLAAAHVLTDLIKDHPCPVNPKAAKGPYSDVFRSRQGLTAGSRRRKLGVVRDFEPFKCSGTVQNPAPKGVWNDIDAGLVQVDDDVKWKQETTCYGVIGAPKPAEPEWIVRRCGPEEPNASHGEVDSTGWNIRIVHAGIIYLFRGQILVRSKFDCDEKEWIHRPPFALPGDSGSLVVHEDDNRPIGMVMAGSVRDNYYFLNPITALEKYWSSKNLVPAKAAPGTSRTVPRPDPSSQRRNRPGRGGRGRGTPPVTVRNP